MNTKALSTHEHQNLYFHSWLLPLMKILLLVSIRWNKIRSYTGKINIHFIIWQVPALLAAGVNEGGCFTHLLIYLVFVISTIVSTGPLTG